MTKTKKIKNIFIKSYLFIYKYYNIERRFNKTTKEIQSFLNRYKKADFITKTLIVITAIAVMEVLTFGLFSSLIQQINFIQSFMPLGSLSMLDTIVLGLNDIQSFFIWIVLISWILEVIWNLPNNLDKI